MAKKDFMSLMKEKTVDVRPSLLRVEEHIKQQIVVLDSLRDLIPPLTDEEYAQLERNLLQYGIKDPLSVWETTDAVAGTDDANLPVYVLIDGHNRYRIATAHQLDYRISILQFATLDEVKDYMINYQLGRRNLTPEQTSYLRGLRYNQQKTARGSNLNTNTDTVNVADSLATEYGVSSRTIKRDGAYAASLEKLDTGTRQAILSGKQKVSKSDLTAPETETSPLSETASGAVPAGLPTVTDQPTGAHKGQIKALQSEIRSIATGSLDKRACTRLLRKAYELLALQSSK